MGGLCQFLCKATKLVAQRACLNPSACSRAMMLDRKEEGGKKKGRKTKFFFFFF